MNLRPYRSTDLATICALDRVCFEPPFRFSRTTMRRVVENPGAIVLLACGAGAEGVENIQGFCAAQIEDLGDRGRPFGYVSTLDVSPEARGQGTGRALMRAMHDAVVRAGGECMLLHVFVNNAPAVRLYQGLEYERVRREHDFYGSGFDAWLYRKELDSVIGPTR